MTLTAKHIKAARVWLDWDQKKLGDEANVSLATVQRIEGSDDQLRGQYDTIDKVRKAFENAGIEFVEGNASGVILHPAGADFGFVADPSAPGGVRRAYFR